MNGSHAVDLYHGFDLLLSPLIMLLRQKQQQQPDEPWPSKSQPGYNRLTAVKHLFFSGTHPSSNRSHFAICSL